MERFQWSGKPSGFSHTKKGEGQIVSWIINLKSMMIASFIPNALDVVNFGFAC